MMTHPTQIESLVIPATPGGPLTLHWSVRHGQAGIQSAANWTPAFAGVTLRKVSDELNHPVR